MRGISITVGRVRGELLQAYLDALTVIDVAQHRLNPSWPSQARAGLRYKRERPGREVWQSSERLRQTKRGDCEDLACDLAASLRVKGIEARAVARRNSIGWHIVVRLPDGRILDPSKKLGM